MGAAALFNGMIAPLTPITVRGVFWYQGESNVYATPAPYADFLKPLIADWRGRFGQPLPFGIVQLANYGKSPADTKAAIVRAAPAQVAVEVTGTGLVVAIDLGEERIHPPNKRDVANRLALWARASVYGETNLVFQSPRYQSQSVQGEKIRINFATGEPALMVGKLDDSGSVNPAPGEKLQWFEIAGADGGFVPAEAVRTTTVWWFRRRTFLPQRTCVTLGGPIHRAAIFTTRPDCLQFRSRPPGLNPRVYANESACDLPVGAATAGRP
jgi:sialate O-acetylesterase